MVSLPPLSLIFHHHHLSTTTMKLIPSIVLGLAALVAAQESTPANEQEIDNSRYNYTEQLTLQPLPRHRLLASFDFESYSDPIAQGSIPASNDYGVFPRSIGQILDQTATQELHLRFSQGWWDAEGWGTPPRNGSFAGGIGVELWAWVEADSVAEAQAHWSKLVNSLSGLFCASLNFIDSAQTTFPRKSFQLAGENPAGKKLHLLRGALPREPVCTENLTPFIKLLPCKGKAGISSLLDGHKIFDAQWQGMAIDVVRVCDSAAQTCQWKLAQVIDAVIDIPRSLRRRDSPVPKPVPYDQLRCDPSKPYDSVNDCFPLSEDPQQHYKLSDIFGRKISGKCPVARNSHELVARVSKPAWEAKIFTGDTPDIAYTTISNKFTLKTANWYDIELDTVNAEDVLAAQRAPVYVERSFTGYGQDKGGVRAVFRNPASTPVRFFYFEALPWFMRVYLHTLKVETIEGPSAGDNVVRDISFVPAIDRKRPNQLELEVEVPGNATVALSYDFDKALLYIEEYPPDANHGFEIPPAAVAVVDGTGVVASLRTTSLLLSLPTPDFSMPYNVIILTCTVMALAFGSLYNLLIKRVVSEEEADALARSHPLRLKLQKLFKRKTT